MVKLVYCLTRRADVEPDEFYRYWLEEHGPLVRSLARELGALRYVQSHTTMNDMNEAIRLGSGFQPAYDGITEVWMESMPDDAAGARAAAILSEDEATFIDKSRSRLFFTTEHPVFDYTAGQEGG